MHAQTMNDRAELLALRIVEELEGVDAVDIAKIDEHTWSRLCTMLGGAPMRLEDTRDWRLFRAVP